MSKTRIPEKVKNLLWVHAGGRCEFDGCNKNLWLDILTKNITNSAYIAHIIADEPGGSRGHLIVSREKCKDLSNLMLMCDTHHRLIDGNAEVYTIDILTKMKKMHEDRIEKLTAIHHDKMSHILLYAGNMGDQTHRINYSAAQLAILDKFYPAEQNPIEINLVGSSIKDNEPDFWSVERRQISRKYLDHVKPRIESGEIKHLSVFALAPQPLLIELGHLISDLHTTDVYQKHREPDTWEWLNDEQSDFNFIITEPVEYNGTVALNLSLSATIDNKRITDVLGEDASIWTITILTPNNDFLKSRRQIELFRQEMRLLFDRIKAKHGQMKLHIFPACPNSVAIELGRVWMPKADVSLALYDQNNKMCKFVHCFDIN